jgi:hypothetical protein
MMVFATIGATALYLLFIWLFSAAAGSWLSQRKGYGERLGLALGLLLSAVGLVIVLLLPGRPGSAWKLDGPFPPRRSGRSPAAESAATMAPASDAQSSSEPPTGPGA